MINIEIHDGISRGKEMSYSPFRDRIEEILEGSNLGDEVFTTLIDSVSQMCSGKKPRLVIIRICYHPHDQDKVGKIIQAFRENKLGVRIETLLLNGVIPAEEMKGGDEEK